MIEWNKLLQRQLKKQYGSLENISENVRPLFKIISDTYDHHDKDRKMLERSIELSSEEMKGLYQNLRKEIDNNNKVLLGKLKESLDLLNEEPPVAQPGSDQLTLSYIADALKNETLKRKAAEERKSMTEKELINTNRMFRLISQINQMIIRVSNEEDIYTEACQIAVGIGKFKTASVAIATPDNSMKNVIEGVIQDLSVLAEVTGILQREVFRTGNPYVCNQISTETLLVGRESLPIERGYRSCIVMPIRRSGKILGTFNLFSDETNFFNPAEIALLNEAAGDMSFALDVLERNRQRTVAEQKLQKSEWRLHQAQAIAHLGSWTLDFGTGKVLCSKEALKIYGINTAEVEQSYSAWLSYIHWEDRESVSQAIKKGTADQSRMSFFHRIIRKDGGVRHLYSQSDFEFDQLGKPIGLYGVVHDLTAIIKAEQSLLSSQADLQAIFDSTSEGFILAGLDCSIKTFNAKARQIMLLNTGQEIRVGDDLRVFAHPSRKGNYDHIVGEIMSGKTIHYQFPFERKNAAVHWFDFTVSPVYSSGTVSGLVITSSEITERKLTELKLVESERRYSNLFQMSPLPMWVYDQETLRFLDVNKAAIKNYGYTKKEFLAMTIKDIRPAEDLLSLEKTIIKNKSRKSAANLYDFRHLKKNGEIILVELQSNVLIYKGKNAKLIIAKDITEKERYIKAIEQQNIKLKEISWMQSHVIRAPLARIMALVPMIHNTNNYDDEQILVKEYLKISANELDEVIMNITEKTVGIDITYNK
ncbi:MAG: PAS domain S-box protein [Bacteroidota bacterium]|nr:PAS domain S-box protein [Bacteroidota bacterium]